MAEINLNEARPGWAGWLAVGIAVTAAVSTIVGFSIYNSGRMELVVEDGELRIERGDFLPWGMSTWAPSAAYEPVPLAVDPELVDLPTGECDDELDCERRFYESTLRLAAHHLERGEAAGLAAARVLIVRAQLFPNISLAERAPIEDLAGGIHYVEALVMLETVRSDLGEIRKKLVRSRIAGLDFVDATRIEALIWMVEREIDLMDRHMPDEAESADEPATGDEPQDDAVASPADEEASTEPI